MFHVDPATIELDTIYDTLLIYMIITASVTVGVYAIYDTLQFTTSGDRQRRDYLPRFTQSSSKATCRATLSSLARRL